MAKKRKTLLKNFQEIINAKDMEAFQSVFEKCDINATGGYGKGTALSFYNLTDEMIVWLVEQGADMDAVNTYGRTPLNSISALRGGKIQTYLTLGANVNTIDTYGDTPLHAAAGSAFSAEKVRLLIAHGANPTAPNGAGQTPLLCALNRTSNGDIKNLPAIVEILLPFEKEVTEEMRKYITEIGEHFEFYRRDYNKEMLPETEAALNRLYEQFAVEPVMPRVYFDGVSQITVKEKTWQKQFDELWQMLVPGSGAATTVQGEVIRICGKVSREILNNGAVNWSRSYKMLPQALCEYFAMGNLLPEPLHTQAISLAKGIGANSDDQELYRLSELAVLWVLANPTPIALSKVVYDR